MCRDINANGLRRNAYRVALKHKDENKSESEMKHVRGPLSLLAYKRLLVDVCRRVVQHLVLRVEQECQVWT
jgi:hypothetical protein